MTEQVREDDSSSRFFRKALKNQLSTCQTARTELQSLLHERVGDGGGSRAGAWLVRGKFICGGQCRAH